MAEDALPPNRAEGFVGQVAGVERVAVAGEVEGDETQADEQEGEGKGEKGRDEACWVLNFET